jgi:O-antigen ligase
MKTTNRDTLFGALLASPLVVFPFARSYLIFYAAIILTALVAGRTIPAIRTERDLKLGTLLFAGPVLITILALGVKTGNIERVWLEKLSLILVAGWLSFSIAGLSTSPRTRSVASTIVGITILFWVLDGLVQLLFGKDLFGIGPNIRSGGERIGAFFDNPYRYAYFIPFLAALPAFWLLSQQRGRLLGSLALIAGGAVALAGGSRYAMLGYGLLAMVFVFVAARDLPGRQRIALLAGTPIGLSALIALLLLVSPSLRDRIADTLIILDGLDRTTLNLALSHRLDIWEPALALAGDHWLFGAGPSQITTAIKPYLPPDSIYVTQNIDVMHAHQVLIEVLVGTGVIGLFCFIAYYSHLTTVAWRQRDASTTFGWGCLLTFLLMWIPFGSQKDIYGSEQMLLSFYLLGLGFGFLRNRETA